MLAKMTLRANTAVQVRPTLITDRQVGLDDNKSRWAWQFLVNPGPDSEIYTLAVDERYEDDMSWSVSRGIGGSPVAERQIGLSYGGVDEDGLPFEPVKLKTFSLCCH